MRLRTSILTAFFAAYRDYSAKHVWIDSNFRTADPVNTLLKYYSEYWVGSYSFVFHLRGIIFDRYVIEITFFRLRNSFYPPLLARLPIK